MRYLILTTAIASLALSGCDAPAEETVEQAQLGDYAASGTDPSWNAEIKGEEISFSTPNGNDFTLPVGRMKQTDDGWEVKGFSDQHNINLYITSGKECGDGTGENKYADTVKVEASKSGTLEGCGDAATKGDDGDS